MKKVLAVVDTYYQLIIAMQLRLTIYRDDTFVLLMSDKSKNAEQVVKSINEQGLFSECHFITNRDLIKKRTFIDRIEDLVQLSFKKNNRYLYYLDDVKEKFFDELIIYNYNIDIIGLYVYLCETNPNLIISFMEEGIYSYSFEILTNRGRSLIKMLRHLLNKKDATDVLEKFYCLNPELYCGTLKPVKIPPIESSSEISMVLKKIFHLDNVMNDYNKKYIFFSSVWDFEGGESIGEYDIACKVADIVGKENILVKIHPRDRRTIYADSGFAIDKNSEIPWEAIQLSADFSKKIFITTTSGSVMAGNFFTNDKPRILYLYPLCSVDNNDGAKKNIENINKILNNPKMHELLDNVVVVDNLRQIL